MILLSAVQNSLRIQQATVKVKVGLSLCLTKHHAMNTYYIVSRPALGPIQTP
jgi:hypothetical protein